MEVQVHNMLISSNGEIQSLQEMHTCFIAKGKEDTTVILYCFSSVTSTSSRERARMVG